MLRAIASRQLGSSPSMTRTSSSSTTCAACRGSAPIFQLADYDMDARVVDDPLYAGEIHADMKSIPTLSIVTDVDHLFGPQNGIYTHRQGRGDAWERPTSAELFFADGTPGFQINCGIRIQGGVSRISKIGKYSLRLLFKSIYGASKLQYPMVPGSPVDTFDTFTLTAWHNKSWAAGNSDAQYIHDTWVKDTQLDVASSRATPPRPLSERPVLGV
jgi:hypothetical protein